jgi:hypothetical protein
MTEGTKKLMNKPDDKWLNGKSKKLFYGKDLEDYVTNSVFNDWCRFNFVERGVKEKIEKDRMYKVWFEYYDASDPMDSSCKYVIYYIEEVPEEIEKAYNDWKLNEQKVKDYLFDK